MKPPVVLIFGESENDREFLAKLYLALHPRAPSPGKRRSPLVLIKGHAKAADRKAALDIQKQVAIERRLRSVPFVIAHQDCDAVEPAHEAASDRIESELAAVDVVAVAATPAWETEAWLYLWPEALVAVNHRWRRPRRDGAHVGRIEDAKEALRRDLRGSPGVRDYQESDAPKVVEQAIRLGLLGAPKARSDSYARFVQRLGEVVRRLTK